jgi:hypothetical protein
VNDMGCNIADVPDIEGAPDLRLQAEAQALMTLGAGSR